MKHNKALAAAAAVFIGALGGFTAEAQQPRSALEQPGCEICIVGTPVVQWSGSSGSFHVDRVENRRNPWLAEIGLFVALRSKYPDFRVPFEWQVPDPFEFQVTNTVWLKPLSPGGSHSNVDSGTIRFDGSKVPAGEYWMAVVLMDCPYPCLYEDYVVMKDKVSCDGSRCTVVGAPPFSAKVDRLVPIVLDVFNGSAHFTSEMSLTNNAWTRLTVSMLYTASLGSKEGSGTVTDSLAPGEQWRIPDIVSYLRERGLAIPSAEDQPSQGGTLLVTFQASEAIDPRLVLATVRTAALTSAPHPVGRAGLAYSGLLPTDSSASSLTLFGLRSSSTDRTNVAVFNTSGDPVTLKVTVHSGSGDRRFVVFREAETLLPYAWMQYGSAQILDENEITTGWVTIERTSQTGSFSAYAVINDSITNDGSFVPPVADATSGSLLTVPILTETPELRSELILANKSGSNVALNLEYAESCWSVPDSGGAMSLQLGPYEQRIIPEAIDFLRTSGVRVGPRNEGSSLYCYHGPLQITVSGAATTNVYAGARTASRSPAGGQFGLFTPGVYSGQEASAEAYLYGLHADAANRTNVAVVNTGTGLDGPILLQLQAYDGDTGGIAKGTPASVSLRPGILVQTDDFLRSSNVSNGWVKVTRMSGSAPWFAYAVVNDGGRPGERTGDGAYVPMVK